MADFKATLINPSTNTFDATEDCPSRKLTIVDNSDYSGNTESGHLQADFSDFRKIIVEAQDGTKFTFSSLGDGDASVDAPSTGNNTVIFDFTTTEDGVYKVTLLTVPTYNNGASYQLNDDFVFFNTKLYQALSNSTNKQPDLNPTDWKEVTEADLPAKYNVFEEISIFCILCVCIEETAVKSFCAAEKSICNDKVLANDADFLNYLKVIVGRDNIDFASKDGNFTSAKNIFNFVKVVCNCK